MTDGILNSLSSAFNRASFHIDKKPILKNDFVKKNVDFMLELLTASNKERGLILHPGTSLPLYFAVILACFKSFLSDDTDKMAFIEELSVGDLVIYQNKRGVFKGKDSEGRIVIENSDKGISTTNRIPFSLVHSISPYYGEAKTLDGRGIRNKGKSKRVISELFNIKTEDIKSTINKSVVIVCEKSEADSLMERLSIIVNEKGLNLRELFPAAYYTSNDFIHYSGNSARMEPLLKFTNKISVARELIIDDKGIETLVIDGTNYFSQEISELASIYNRSSLKCILMLGELYKGLDSLAFDSFENLNYLLWTKDNLNEINHEPLLFEGSVCQESENLQKIIQNIMNLEVKVIKVENNVKENAFFECKKALHQLLKHNDQNNKIDSFITKGFWLLNLLERSFFPISVMEKLIKESQINCLSPTEELIILQKNANEYIGSTYEAETQKIVSLLEEIKREMDHNNSKFNYITEYIKQNKYNKKKVAIIGAKTYYQKIFLEAVPTSLKEAVEKCDIYTPNKFSSSTLYHDVFIVGISEWEKLNPLLISNAKSVLFVLYNNERMRLIQAEVQTKKRLLKLRANKQEWNNYEEHIAEYAATKVDVEDIDEMTVEFELEKFTGQFAFNYAINELRTTDTNGLYNSEIIRIAILDTGEKIFFTKFYSPYVFDVDRQVVNESDVSSLKTGDLLIFTNYDSDTRDIVERIMDTMVENKNCDERFIDSLHKSHYWKTILKEFMERNKLTYKELSQKMSNFGKGKHEVTLRTWLAEGNHIVGPRDSESYLTIAKITNDSQMLDDSESYFQACREVRSMRTRILKYIGKNIIQTYNKNIATQDDELLSKLPIDISKMSRIVQIDKIIDADELLIIPSHSANRPQTL
jgi:hypothetical protein